MKPSTSSALRTVWITGASTGIGAALAQELLQQGHTVVVTARRRESLLALAQAFPERCIPLVADLTDAHSLSQLAEDLRARVSSLDTLVLNAGTCEYVDVEQFQAAPFTAVFQLNLLGAVHSLEAALPLLRRSSAGAQIVGISSMATLLPMPRSQAYGASKAALEYLLNSLRVDLAPEGIAVTVVRPGFVQTPLTDRNDFAMPFLVTPEYAARAIARGMARRRYWVQFPAPLVVIMSLISYLPLRWQTALLKKMSRNKV